MRKWHFFELFIVLIGWLAVPAVAQESPDFSQGLTPWASVQGGEIDNVNMADRRLQLRIPLLADHSQRGSLNFTYSVTYSSMAWIVQRVGNSALWYPAQPATVTPIFYPTGDDWPSTRQLGNYQGAYGPAKRTSVADADGAQHDLGTTSTSPYIARSIDGSGFLLEQPTSGGTELINRNGIQFRSTSTALNFLSFSSATDPNGNTITVGSTGSTTTVTDTLGRTWITTAGSTDVTHCPVAATSSTLWAVPGVSGTTRTFKLCYSTINVNTAFNAPGVSEYNGTFNVLTGIVLPNLTTWEFSYNNDGDLAKVTLPTGGYIAYTFASPGGPGCSGTAYARYVTSRTVFDGSRSATWNYTISTITDPLGNDTVYAVNGGCLATISQVQYYSGSQTGGTLLKTVATTYQTVSDPYPRDMLSTDGTTASFPLTTTTTWPNGQVSQLQRTYDAGFTYTDTNRKPPTTFSSIYGLVTSEARLDYGNGSPGPKLSTTNTSYLPLTNSAYLSANLLNLISSLIVLDANGNKCAETDYLYDDPTRLFASGITEQHGAAPNPSPVRGNVSSAVRDLTATPCQVGAVWTSITANTNHYDTGEIYQSIEPVVGSQTVGSTTTYTYSSTFYGTYVTTATDALQQTTNHNYDFDSGLLMSTTDENGNTTSYTYDDMFRVTSVTDPPQIVSGSSLQGVTTFTYTDTVGNLNVEHKSTIDSSRSTDAFVYYDGLGRDISQSVANGETVPWDKTDTCYDLDGRKTFVSYPYQANTTPPAAGCPAEAGDNFGYDSMARLTSITHSDGSVLSTSYVGRATDVLDEGNGTRSSERVSQVDGLGRLATVCEVTSGALSGPGGTPSACGQDVARTGFLTTYSYDAMGNLLGVTQGALAARTFTYDSLSRLLTSINPETGSTNYVYATSSGALCNGDLEGACQKTDSRNTTTTYTYDALNRLTQKSFSDGTPSVKFGYDQSTVTLNTSPISISNSIGRLSWTASVNSSGVSITMDGYSYDSMGRIVNYYQRPPSNSNVFSMPVGYDLVGDVLSKTNANGLSYTSSYSVAPRLTQLTSSWLQSGSQSGGTLVSAMHYNAFGKPVSSTLYNGVNESWGYDARGRTTSYSAGSLYSYSVTNPSNGSNGYAPNGVVLYATDSINGKWSYSYDDFNHLSTSTCSSNCPDRLSTQAFSYGYDRYGNRWKQTVTAGSGPQPQFTFNGPGNVPNNRIDGPGPGCTASQPYCYDQAGNLLNDGTHSYSYDAEDQLISVDNGNTATYIYDGNGRRVSKTTASGTVNYLYDLTGRQVTEVAGGTSTTNRSEVFASDRHLATENSTTTYFSHADWLGTERAHTTLTGSVCESIVSLPFGDGQATQGSCGDPSPLHFTGKMRDSETGLDDFDARYYSSTGARFMTPDWDAKPVDVPYAKFGDPQTLNLYGYVENQPLNRVDADGHCCVEEEVIEVGTEIIAGGRCRGCHWCGNWS
jgi:RHS repeat-associated protein